MKKYLTILFVCGILSSLLYFATDIISGLLWQGYSFNSQTVSELSAIGAPTRTIWQVMTFVTNPLLIAFGIGVIGAARNNRAQRMTGTFLIVWGVLGFLWLLFPMNLRGAIGTATDTMHLVMTAVTVVVLTALLIVGSRSQGKKFFIYSMLTLGTMIIFGIATGSQASRVPAQLPTPWMGITERVTSYAPLIWVIVLAVLLMRKEKTEVSKS